MQTDHQGGGAIACSCSSLECNVSIANSTFSNNSAALYGGAIFFFEEFNFQISANNIFTSNTASVGDDIVSFPKKFICVEALTGPDEAKAEIKNQARNFNFSRKVAIEIASGKIYFMACGLLDAQGNFLQEQNEGELRISNEQTENQTITFEKNKVNFKSGLAYFESLRVFLLPGTKRLDSKLEFFLNERLVFSDQIEISSRNCKRGEVFSNEVCVECGKGYFSLDAEANLKNITNCQSCPKFSSCMRDLIVPEAGEKYSYIINIFFERK